MKAHAFACVVLTLLQLADVAHALGKVTLEKLSTLYFPRRFSDDGTGLEFEFNSGTAQQFAYDKSRQLAYAVGHDNIYVVSNSNPNNLALVHAQSLRDDDVSFIDVEFCRGFVIAIYINVSESSQSKLQIYREYDQVTDEVKLIQEITLPSNPDSAVPTTDCKKIVVSIEGDKVFDENGTFVRDPPGEILIAKVPPGGDLEDTLTTIRLDFTDFDGLRNYQGFVQTFFGSDGKNPLSNDIEPDFVELSKDEKFAYVTLQENNGIAVVDLQSHKIVHIFGLGFKKYSEVKLDTSDQDGGINLIPRPEIHGLRAPEAVRVTHIMGEDILVTADEGCNTIGLARVRDVTLDPDVFPDRDELQKDENLGQLVIDSIVGDTNKDGLVDKLFLHGTRGFSLFNAWDGSLVFDSGDSVAINFSTLRPDIFNPDNNGDDTLQESFDKRSPNRGLEPEHVFVQKVGVHLTIFVGLERPGCILTYVIDTTEIPIRATFEDLFCNIPMRPTATWNELYEERAISEVRVQEMRLILPQHSPTGEAILLALGTTSGTLSSFRINFRDKSTTVETTTQTTTTTSTSTRSTTTTRRPTTRKPKRRFPKRMFKGRRRFGFRKKGCFKRRNMRGRHGFRRSRKVSPHRH